MRAMKGLDLTWVLGVLCVLWGCDSGGDETPQPTADQGVLARTCVDRAAELAAQCPPGSNPEVHAAGTACAASGEVLDPEGVVRGLCQATDGCVLFCNFQNPCQCGIDRITEEGVFCASCEVAAACGNQVCEGGESPETCPEDCGDVCRPGAERCSGEVREFCQPNGDWDPAACRSDQSCALVEGDRTFCQTRLSPAGGTYVAPVGQPFAGDGDPLAVRFEAARLPCTGDCQPLRFVEGGARVLVRRGQGLALITPEDGTFEDTGFTVLGQFAVTEDHVATSARQPVVIDRARRTTFTADAIVDDTTGLTPGGVALTADGSELAVALAVEDTPLVATWGTGAGEARHLLRFVDPAVVTNEQATVLAFSPGGALLAEGRAGGLIVLWNVAEGRYVHLLQTDLGRITTLAFDPTGAPRLLAGGSGLELWDVEAATRSWREPSNAVNFLAISPDGQALAASGERVWVRRMADGGEARVLEATGPVHFAPDGHRLLAGAVLFADRF